VVDDPKVLVNKAASTNRGVIVRGGGSGRGRAGRREVSTAQIREYATGSGRILGGVRF